MNPPRLNLLAQPRRSGRQPSNFVPACWDATIQGWKTEANVRSKSNPHQRAGQRTRDQGQGPDRLLARDRCHGQEDALELARPRPRRTCAEAFLGARGGRSGHRSGEGCQSKGGESQARNTDTCFWTASIGSETRRARRSRTCRSWNRSAGYSTASRRCACTLAWVPRHRSCTGGGSSSGWCQAFSGTCCNNLWRGLSRKARRGPGDNKTSDSRALGESWRSRPSNDACGSASGCSRGSATRRFANSPAVSISSRRATGHAPRCCTRASSPGWPAATWWPPFQIPPAPWAGRTCWAGPCWRTKTRRWRSEG
jgi:hypothetical protein